MKDQQVAGPLHRRLSKEHLGGGVFLIIVVELVVGFSGHWQSPEAKIILGATILLSTWWIREELRYRNWSRFKAWAASCLFAVASAELSILAYASLEKPQEARQSATIQTAPTPVPTQVASTPIITAVPFVSVSPTPSASLLAALVPTPLTTPAITPQTKTTPPDLAFSKFTPDELCEKVRLTQPFQKDAVAKSFVGTPVKWKLWFYRVHPLGNNWYVSFKANEKPVGVLVYITLSERDVAPLRAANEGEKFLVSGIISDVTWSDAELKNAQVVPAE